MQFPQAVRACADVRRDEGLFPVRSAWEDGKRLFLPKSLKPGKLSARHNRQRRQLRAVCQGQTEGVYAAFLALHLARHAVTGVSYKADKPALPRQPVQEGAKPHSLHDALCCKTGPANHLASAAAFAASAAFFFASAAAFMAASCSGVNFGLGGAFLITLPVTMKSSFSVPVIM